MPASTPYTRRSLLRNLFLTGGAVSAAPLLTACGAARNTQVRDDQVGNEAIARGELSIPSGPLANIGPVGAADFEGVAVPEGFSVRPVARHGVAPALGSAYPWHAFPDGGACFPRDNGGWVYTSNSEVPSVGGCGALVFDPDASVVDAYAILRNTSSNCAGGKTPWNTWLSCEETATGLVWETDPYGQFDAVSKPALGLFSHEAAVVDLAQATVYLTEDSGDGRFYRWVADAADYSQDRQRLNVEQGRLQVLNIQGLEDGAYADDPAVLRKLHAVSWVDVISPDQAQSTVRASLDNSGAAVPGTRFPGGEGLWFYTLPEALRSVPPGGFLPTRDIVYFTSKGDNRVYALDIANQLIEIIFDNENDQIDTGFSDVDNLTVSPAGDILVAEDLTESGRSIRIMVIIPNQPAKVLVELQHPGSEICGPAFSPDGSRLYFSSQRGPNLPGGHNLPEFLAGTPGVGSGVTYELLIPAAFRAD
ncbi:MAG: alkaline phosphatase PhoX [Oceanococcus sp.]